MKERRTDPGAERLGARPSLAARVGGGFVTVLGALALTLLGFLLLPLIQAIGAPLDGDLLLTTVDAAALPPPPPPVIEEEEEPEPEPEEEPPELIEDVQPLDLSQLELALDPGFGEGMLGGDFALRLNALGGEGQAVDELFDLADLDQPPRAVYQPSPSLNAQVRKRAPCKVWVIFVVDEQGRVVDPRVQSSTDPVFDQPALAAVKKWRFEPGKRKGKAVRLPMKIPITFPAQQ
jgi:protein TonB